MVTAWEKKKTEEEEEKKLKIKITKHHLRSLRSSTPALECAITKFHFSKNSPVNLLIEISKIKKYIPE